MKSTKLSSRKLLAMAVLAAGTQFTALSALAQTAYLEITLKVAPENRPAAAAVYNKYRTPFLKKISGAKSKELLVRSEDVQVLHGFTSMSKAQNYLTSELFTKDVVSELTPLLQAPPEVRIYEAN